MTEEPNRMPNSSWTKTSNYISMCRENAERAFEKWWEVDILRHSNMNEGKKGR